MVEIKGKQLAEFASDIQTGLGCYEVSEFDDLRTIGMAASLAVHLRGLPEISYGVLSQVSDACFDIPAPMLKPVLRLLKEVGMVRLYESGKTITKIDPTVPYSKTFTRRSVNRRRNRPAARLHQSRHIGGATRSLVYANDQNA